MKNKEMLRQTKGQIDKQTKIIKIKNKKEHKQRETEK